MSLSFTVSYDKESRRVTCERSSTVGALLASCMQKFKLPAATNGKLLYGGKILDPSTPLRFTNLVNNAKLNLQICHVQTDITLKVIASISGASSTQILKLKSSTPLRDMVAELRSQSGVSWSDSAKISVNILHNAIDSSSPRFDEVSVGSVVGYVSSAVLRVNIEDRGDEKEASVKLTEDGKKVFGVKPTENEKDSSVKPTEREEDKQMKSTSVVDQQTKVKSAENKEKNVIKTPVLDRMSHVDSGIESNQKDAAEKPVGQPKQDRGEIPENIQTQSSEDSRLPQVPRSSHDSQDVVYRPLTSTKLYENPDEDYELTSNQAEKYYKMLKSMQGRPQAKKNPAAPSHYTIRLRFPDRALLDLHFDDPAVKLGMVLKKIDSHINEQFINSYKLRNSSPPFDEIKTTFASNNSYLKDLPVFQSGKVLLIWEPESLAGNYLKSDIVHRDVAELPTVKLEATRGSLADDSVAPKKPAKGIPKWFKPGK